MRGTNREWAKAWMNSWIKILRKNKGHKCKSAVRVRSTTYSMPSWLTRWTLKDIRAKQPISRIPKTLLTLIWLMHKCSIVFAGRHAHLMGMERIQLIDWTIKLTNLLQSKQGDSIEQVTMISITVSKISQGILSSLHRAMRCNSLNFRKLDNCWNATRPMSLGQMKSKHLKNRMILIWPSWLNEDIWGTPKQNYNKALHNRTISESHKIRRRIIFSYAVAIHQFLIDVAICTQLTQFTWRAPNNKDTQEASLSSIKS